MPFKENVAAPIMEPYGLLSLVRITPDPSGTFHNLPVLPNLLYMPETIQDTPGTIPGSSGTSRNHSETIRDTLGTLLSFIFLTNSSSKCH